MIFALLHFGSGAQALHYFILCFASLIGTIQLVAARCHRRDLLWLDVPASFFLGAMALPASFAWFFFADEEIFNPGLAGGEIITIFLAAFLAAVPTTRVVARLLAQARLTSASANVARVKEPLQ